MPSLGAVDIAVIVAYFVGLSILGTWFARRTNSSERFMAAGRSFKGWVLGLALFGSFVSSISFLGGPGRSFGGNWSPFVFSLALPLAAWVAAKWFVPFFRARGELSAYEHLEGRFGPWARVYATGCYLLMQLTRTGVVMYLLALALTSFTGWPFWLVVVLLGLLMTLYPLLGGTESAIWTGMVQSLVLVAGALISLVVVFVRMPEGPAQVFEIAWQADKFSLGGFDTSLGVATFWVVFLYGIVENLRNFGATQTYVQLYATAGSEREARTSVWLTAALYVPLSAVFFLIGTALFAFYQAQPGLLPLGTLNDGVFPHFIATQLPAGLTGLVIAAVCAAATDSSFNCVATLFLQDFYGRFIRPGAGDGERLRVLRLATLGAGVLSTAIALAIFAAGAGSILDAWWALAGIMVGGVLGLFLLGLLVGRAGSLAGAVGVIGGSFVILWMTLSGAGFEKAIRLVIPSYAWPEALAFMRSPFHNFLVPVVGTLVVLVLGRLTVLFQRAAAKQPNVEVVVED